MYKYKASPKYICKEKGCGNRIHIDDLENVFSETLKSFFFSEEEIASYLETTNEDISTKQELVSHQSSALSKLKTEMDKIYKLYIDDMISPAEFKERYSPLEIRKINIEKDLPRLQAELDVLKVNLNSKDQIILEAQSLYSKWSTLSFQQKREIVESITESIIIGNGDVEINLHYVPDLQATKPNITPQTPISHPSAQTSSKMATNNHGFIAAIN